MEIPDSLGTEMDEVGGLRAKAHLLPYFLQAFVLGWGPSSTGAVHI